MSKGLLETISNNHFPRSIFPMQKIIVIVVVALSLATAAIGYLNKSKLSESIATASRYKEEAAANAKKADKTASELKTANQKLAISGTDAQKNATEVTELRSKAAKATSALTDVQKQVADKEAVITQQKSDIAAKDARISQLESKANNTNTQPTQPTSDSSIELKKQLEEKDILTTSLQTKLKDQETQLSALKEREAQRRSKSMRSGLEGRILAVNTAWNFVVLSLGDRNGVINNAEMLIKRGSQLIGKVRITSVEPSTSIADIVANSVRSGLTVQPGDTVIYMGPGEEAEPKLP